MLILKILIGGVVGSCILWGLLEGTKFIRKDKEITDRRFDRDWY